MLRAILNNKQMSLYQLEKNSKVSHATLNDIYNEKSNIDNCSISTMSRIAKSLDMDLNDLYMILSYENLSLFAYDEDFDLFKSNILQLLKKSNESDYVNNIVKNKTIEEYYEKEEYLKAFYLLSLVDYLCEKNNVPKLEQYDEIRQKRLAKIYVPKSIYLLLLTKHIKVSDIFKECIKTFLNHNIVEAEVDKVA